MARRPRQNHSPAFKAKGEVVTIKGEKTVIELAQVFVVPSNRITATRLCYAVFRSRPMGESGVNRFLSLLNEGG
jgi:hypothetical protein